MSEIEMIWFPVLREDCKKKKKNPSILVEISPVDKHLSCIKRPQYSVSTTIKDEDGASVFLTLSNSGLL